jgi:competence protein ComEC
MAAPGSGGRLVALPLAWLAGVAVQLQQRELWRFESYLAVTIIAVAVALISARSRRAFALLVAAALATGFALTGIQASARLAETLPPALEGRDVVVTGVVANLPQQGPSGLRFRFEVDAGGAPAGVPSLLALGWYAGFHEDATLVQPRLALRAGQRCVSPCACANRTAI